ncbi:MAG: hypothetical protein ABGW69_02880 [Nanoarchaeota archaeon]
MEIYYLTLGVIYTLIITLPFVMGYFNLYSFLKYIVEGEFKKAKKKISKDKLVEIIFAEEKIKYYVVKKLDDFNRMNYSLSMFYITLSLLVLVVYLASTESQTLFTLFNAFFYTFIGISFTLFIYLLIKIWLSIKIVSLIIKLDEMEIVYLKELQELEEESEKERKE